MNEDTHFLFCVVGVVVARFPLGSCHVQSSTSMPEPAALTASAVSVQGKLGDALFSATLAEKDGACQRPSFKSMARQKYR